MFCIAAFIVLAIISIFSASHRKLAKKAWGCTFRRITFRPCDVSFKEDTKNKILAKVAHRTPKLVKAADIGIEIASFAFVVLTVWSLLSVVMSGVNLFVWGTCSPNEASACSLGAETCSISKSDKNLWELTSEGKPLDWFSNQISTVVNTFANIPTRLKSWDATDYLPKNVSYYNAYEKSKPTALEIVDPGCIVCSKLFRNIKTAGFELKYNLAYIAYPIENPDKPGVYKFKNSYVIASYLEAIKMSPLAGSKIPVDWKILQRIYSEYDNKNQLYQAHISLLSNDKTRDLLDSWLNEFGYDDVAVVNIRDVASSSQVKQLIKDNQSKVVNEIRTVKIPTIIFGGQRRDGLVQVDSLK
jgi:hypothetical protein